MSHIWTSVVDEILHQGCWLGNLGIQNWALDRSLTLDVLSQLERAGVAVLGGDVYIRQGEAIEPSYDNWYCERRADETVLAFVSRSTRAAREYVIAYSPNRRDVLFALVPQITQL
jgi:hypothetical protein